MSDKSPEIPALMISPEGEVRAYRAVKVGTVAGTTAPVIEFRPVDVPEICHVCGGPTVHVGRTILCHSEQCSGAVVYDLAGEPNQNRQNKLPP